MSETSIKLTVDQVGRRMLLVQLGDLDQLEIEGVRYSAELFRVFAAPDPGKFYRFERAGGAVTVTDCGPASQGTGVVDLARKILYTRQEAAHLLSLSLASVQELLHRRRLRGVTKGRRILIHRDELERFAKQETPGIWQPKPTERGARPGTRRLRSY